MKWDSLCMTILGAVLCPVLLRAETQIAVVNLPIVSERFQRTADLEAKFDGIRKELGQKRDAMQERINRLRQALQEELVPRTLEYDARRKEIALLEAEMQWFVESEGQKVERGLASSLRSIFDDIQSVIRELAIEKNLDIVLASDQLPADPPDSPTQVRQHILLQKVLYWSPRVDITDEVIQRLNVRYQASLQTSDSPAKPTSPGSGGSDQDKSPEQPSATPQPR